MRIDLVVSKNFFGYITGKSGELSILWNVFRNNERKVRWFNVEQISFKDWKDDKLPKEKTD